MSTTAVTPAKPVSAASELGIISAYLKSHERLIVIVMLIATSWWGLQKYYDHHAVTAETRATVAESAKAVSDDAAAKSAVVLQQAMAQLQATNALLAAQSQALAQAVAARQSAVVVQQKKDSTLAPSALASHIATLSGAPPAEVTLDGTNIALGSNAALAVAQTLELVPELQANLTDETTIAENTQKQLAAAGVVIVDQTTQIANLNTKIVTDGKASAAEIAMVKADAKKNSGKWFKRGLIVGFIGGLFAGHAGF